MLIPTAQIRSRSPRRRGDGGVGGGAMPMDAMIIPLNARRANPPTRALSIPARHLAIEPPAWTVSLSDASGDKPPSPAWRPPSGF